MADRAWSSASVASRTTVAAVLVVAVALVVGAFALVTLVSGSLRDGVEASAEQRASSLADQIDSSGLPDQPEGEDADDDDLEDEVWQVTDADGTVVRSSQQLSRPLPRADGDEVTPAGADVAYYVVTEDADGVRRQVAVSLEEVEDSRRRAATTAARRAAAAPPRRRWHHLDGGHPCARARRADPARGRADHRRPAGPARPRAVLARRDPPARAHDEPDARTARGGPRPAATVRRRRLARAPVAAGQHAPDRRGREGAPGRAARGRARGRRARGSRRGCSGWSSSSSC